MIWKNADSFETARKMENYVGKSGQFGNPPENGNGSGKIRIVLKLSGKWEMIWKIRTFVKLSGKWEMAWKNPHSLNPSVKWEMILKNPDSFLGTSHKFIL